MQYPYNRKTFLII